MASTVNTAQEKNLSKKVLIKDIQTKSKCFLQDRKQANNLLDILANFQLGEDEVTMATIRAVHKVFVQLLTQQEMYMECALSGEEISNASPDEKLKLWLRDRYAETRNILLELLTQPNTNIQELSLCTLMKFVEAESTTPLRKVSKKHIAFPAVFFEQIVHTLLNTTQDLRALLGRFQEYLEYDDCRYYAMKTALRQLKEKECTECSDMYLGNVHALLEQLSMPLQPEEDKLDRLLSTLPESESTLKINSHKEHRKLFTSVWLQFLRMKLPTSLYKKVLLVLHEKVMPHMTSPLLLCDFLTTSYNIGGAISLLALNGIFVLVNTHNLDYPDFYKKLYALFEPSVFHVKYRARFFFLADLFLTSSHLPSYTVAAFAKKLARLALVAPPSGLTVLLPFIFNLLRRHPSCKVLLHKPDGPTDVSSDPYNMEEPDPAKCNALDSSLWELKTLCQHYHHACSLGAKKMEQPLAREETDLSSLFETTMDDLYEQEAKRQYKEVATNFEAPKGLFGSKDDLMREFWSLD